MRVHKKKRRKSTHSGSHSRTHSRSHSKSVPTSAVTENGRPLPLPPVSRISRELDPLYREHVLLQTTATRAVHRRQQSTGTKRRTWAGPESAAAISNASITKITPPTKLQVITFWNLMREIYPTIPNKWFLSIGIMLCVLAGALTPIFSFFLSRLMYEVSIASPSSTSIINVYGGIVLSLAALDGILIGAKFITMEIAALQWVTHLRALTASKVLAQDKAWFDHDTHSPVRIMQILVKDGDDARSLISSVLGQCVVVVTMVSVGIVWAIILGWQLTLVGVGLAPVFAGIMGWQAGMVEKCEFKNKRARETVSKAFYDVRSFQSPYQCFAHSELILVCF